MKLQSISWLQFLGICSLVVIVAIVFLTARLHHSISSQAEATARSSALLPGRFVGQLQREFLRLQVEISTFPTDFEQEELTLHRNLVASRVNLIQKSGYPVSARDDTHQQFDEFASRWGMLQSQLDLLMEQPHNRTLQWELDQELIELELLLNDLSLYALRDYQMTLDAWAINLHQDLTRAMALSLIFTLMLVLISIVIFQMFQQRRQTEEAMRKAKEEAEEANQTKSVFLANMSHEIRTPLNGVIGMLELVRDGNLSVEQRDYVTTARDSANALSHLINDILDVSKVEAGKLELVIEPFEPRRVVNDAIQLLHLRAQQKQLTLQAQIASDIPFCLLGDPMRLRQILINLLGNAIKFTDDGEIALDVSLYHPAPKQSDGTDCGGQYDSETNDNVMLHFCIADTGVGIPADQQELIFQSFTQADSSTTRRFGGTGLGLTISQTLTQMMGGQIWIESQLGQGSRFHFTAQFGQSRTEYEHVQSISISQLDKETTRHRSYQDHPALETQPLPLSLRVLLAEDNPINQKLAIVLLKRYGCQIEVAETGLEVLQKLEDHQYDVILMDVQMPVMNGLEATRRIRLQEQRTTDHLPIIAMTANAMKGDREACLQAGMDEYLMKPIRPQAVLDAIQRVTAMKNGSASHFLGLQRRTH